MDNSSLFNKANELYNNYSTKKEGIKLYKKLFYDYINFDIFLSKSIYK